MKCYNHNESDAVGQCGICWIWICRDCISNMTFDNKILCKRCSWNAYTEVKIDENLLKKDILLVCSWWILWLFLVISLWWWLMEFSGKSYIGLLGMSIDRWFWISFIAMTYYLLYRIWKYIPSISGILPGFFTSNMIVLIILYMLMFSIVLSWWFLYVLFIFPITHIRYLNWSFWSQNNGKYMLKVSGIYFLFAVTFIVLMYYGLF